MIKLFGAILMAIGILIATLSGLCCARILVGPTGHYNGATLDGLLLVAVIGGVPFVSGLGLFFGGLVLVRGTRKPRK